MKNMSYYRMCRDPTAICLPRLSPTLPTIILA